MAVPFYQAIDAGEILRDAKFWGRVMTDGRRHRRIEALARELPSIAEIANSEN
jgi:hypothetical protein